MKRDQIDPEWLAAYDLAVELARAAGAIQRERYETDLDIQTKSASIDLVTEVDRACEAAIVAGIQSGRPGDAILAEEGGGDDDPARFLRARLHGRDDRRPFSLCNVSAPALSAIPCRSGSQPGYSPSRSSCS